MSENLQKFINLVNDYVAEYYKNAVDLGVDYNKHACDNKFITAKVGKKYIKLGNKDTVFAFVDIITGDIYKPASFSVPAKIIRGNINSDSFGAESLIFVPGTAIVYIRYAYK